jgi:RNA polymerase sigma-70 factor (ECF subfamily)
MIDWETIVHREGRLIFGVAWRILRNADDAADITQDVLFELFKRSQARGVEECRGLAYRMATFRSLDRLRQRKNCLRVDDLDLAAASRGPEDLAIAAELSERLRVAVARLPDRMATVFCLRYFEDLASTEIAEMLSISRSAVSTALSKARDRITEMLKIRDSGD